MSLASLLLARAAKLPRRMSRASRTRHRRIEMRDGVGLETEIYRPRLPGKFPTILVRIPYGLRGFAAAAETYGERGYNAVIQACRGTSRSEGVFDPLTHEREDGLDTLEWIKQQPWYDGRLGTAGPSYLGYAQWAICDALPETSAMAIRVSSAEFKSVVFPGGTFQLGLWLGWLQVIDGLRNHPWRMSRSIGRGEVEQKTLAASMQLPLIDADRRVTGHDVPFWKRWLTLAIGNDEFWKPLDHTHRIGPKTPRTSFISGWYDFMLEQLLRDYAMMADAGTRPYLEIGPWFHVSPDLQLQSLRDSLVWMDAELKGDHSGIREKPVRLYIGGLDQWRDFDAYPPGPPVRQTWHLHSDRLLAPTLSPSSPPDRYRYDPADPTPNLGGALFAFSGVGPLDQAPLEHRNDVLLYTSEPLAEDVTIIGNVQATVYVRASLPNVDIFAKLCDVNEKGHSINICDAIVRKTDAMGIWTAELQLHATAHTFRRGHRLRLLVASGAHPRYARNTGTDEPFGTAATLRAADIEIFHDPDHPSAITLPIYGL